MATYSLTLRGLKGSKLTTSELDDNFLYLEELAMSGGGDTSLVELTYAEAVDLVDSGGVIEGTRYLVTGVDPDLWGGTDVLVQGLPDSNLSLSGWGKFYNPRYDVIEVYYGSNSYSIDDLVIYGGKVWKNLTGSVGFIDVYLFELDPTNWELQDDFDNESHYVLVWDKVEIGFSGGQVVINSRYDSIRNNYVRVGQLDGGGSDRWFFCGVNPLAAFGWGNDSITDCTIKDSYFNCLNIVNSQIYGVEMSNYSYWFDSTIVDSYVESLNFTNESGIYNVWLDGSEIRNCKFQNNSYMNGDFHNTTIEYLDLSNNSYCNILEFWNSTLANLNLNNNSNCQSIFASASYFQNITLNNQSWIQAIELTTGILANSWIERVELSNRSYINNIDLYDSTMYEIKLDNYSYIEGSPHIDLWNSSLNYLSLDNHSRIFGPLGLSSSYFKRINMNNRSRLQGNNTLVSSYLEKLDSTNDGYIYNLNFENVSAEDIDIRNSDFGNITCRFSQLTQISLNQSSLTYIGMTSSGLYNIDCSSSLLSVITMTSSSLGSCNLDRSGFNHLQLNNSNIGQMDFEATYLSLSALGTHSTNFPSGTSFKYNELKYQIPFTFTGLTGYGVTNNELSIPAMIIPQDFYIDKVVIESSNLVYSGSAATFSLSIPGLSPSVVEISASDMTGIKVLDISNGSIQGYKADVDDMLVAFLTGGTDITSGGIKMEVTIKNTRYFYD